MKSTFKITILFLLAFWVSSCGIIGRRGDRDIDKRTRAEYKIEEMDLLGDEGVVTADVPAARDGANGNEFEFAPRPETVPEDDQFFSAQVFASKSSAEARDFLESVRSAFEDEVMIDYQAPYYRVCVGYAEGIEEAEVLLKRVNARGFPQAWLVKLRK